MLRVNSQINKYNYHLIAYEVGSLAADFGETVNDSIPKPPPKKVVPKKDGGKAKAKDKEEAKPKEEADDDEKNSTPTVANHSLAELYTGMLVKELYQALNGTEGASDSGMAHVPSSTLGPTATIVRQITDLEAAIAKAAAELVAAGPGQIVERKKDLSDRIASMKTFLTKNPPKDLHLVPGSPFEVAIPPIAEVPDPKPAAEKPKARAPRVTADSGGAVQFRCPPGGQDFDSPGDQGLSADQQGTFLHSRFRPSAGSSRRG